MLVQLRVSDGFKNGLALFPPGPQTFQQADHRLVIRHQNLTGVECQRKMPIAYLKGDFHGLVETGWNNFNYRLDRGFHFQVPFRTNVENRAVREYCACGKGDTDFASLCCCKTSSHPAA